MERRFISLANSLLFAYPRVLRCASLCAARALASRTSSMCCRSVFDSLAYSEKSIGVSTSSAKSVGVARSNDLFSVILVPTFQHSNPQLPTNLDGTSESAFQGPLRKPRSCRCFQYSRASFFGIVDFRPSPSFSLRLKIVTVSLSDIQEKKTTSPSLYTCAITRKQPRVPRNRRRRRRL